MREDFKKKVTLALKQAAEMWRVGSEVTRKGPSKQREQQRQSGGGGGGHHSGCKPVCKAALVAVGLGLRVCQEKTVAILENTAGPACRGLPMPG